MSIDQNFAISRVSQDNSYFLNICSIFIRSLKKYILRLDESHVDQDPSQTKIILVGKKYRKEDAIDQLTYSIQRIRTIFALNETNQINPEDEPEWYGLPQRVLSVVLECPFLFDLIKSESFDWEVNHTNYQGQHEKNSDFCLGVFSSLLHELT